MTQIQLSLHYLQTLLKKSYLSQQQSKLEKKIKMLQFRKHRMTNKIHKLMEEHSKFYKQIKKKANKKQKNARRAI